MVEAWEPPLGPVKGTLKLLCCVLCFFFLFLLLSSKALSSSTIALSSSIYLMTPFTVLARWQERT